MPILLTYLYIILLYLCGYAFAQKNIPLVDLLLLVFAILAYWQYLPYALLFVPGSGLIIFGISLATFVLGLINAHIHYNARQASQTKKPDEDK